MINAEAIKGCYNSRWRSKLSMNVKIINGYTKAIDGYQDQSIDKKPYILSFDQFLKLKKKKVTISIEQCTIQLGNTHHNSVDFTISEK